MSASLQELARLTEPPKILAICHNIQPFLVAYQYARERWPWLSITPIALHPAMVDKLQVNRTRTSALSPTLYNICGCPPLPHSMHTQERDPAERSLCQMELNKEVASVLPIFFGRVSTQPPNRDPFDESPINFLVPGNIEPKRRDYRLMLSLASTPLPQPVQFHLFGKCVLVRYCEEVDALALQLSAQNPNVRITRGNGSYARLFNTARNAHYILSLADERSPFFIDYTRAGKLSSSLAIALGFHRPFISNAALLHGMDAISSQITFTQESFEAAILNAVAARNRTATSRYDVMQAELTEYSTATLIAAKERIRRLIGYNDKQPAVISDYDPPPPGPPAPPAPLAGTNIDTDESGGGGEDNHVELRVPIGSSVAEEGVFITNPTISVAADGSFIVVARRLVLERLEVCSTQWPHA